MNADIVLLTGSPGSGKTTTARGLATTYAKSVHLHTDDFWHSIVSGRIAPFLPESNAQNETVMTVIQRAAWAYAAGGFVTVIDGIIGPWMLHHFREPTAAVEGVGSRLHYIVLRPSRDEALRRAQQRTAPGALVDEAPVIDLWHQFADLASFEPHVIDTTTHCPEQTLAAVQRMIARGEALLPRG
ncbi:MAG: AAA family ATPase [Microcella sp.]|uniref:AAA family ATPase n=1 Tax=Microcella sp. TaxID=1913979 RepID=UPI0024C93842|nr:AAA family ATPase [Microcella sp.]UYN84460.1 MAG: AAA family ATPase [Microcella sp.]